MAHVNAQHDGMRVDDTGRRILQCLRGAGTSVRSSNLAQRLGVRSKKEINPVLYNLQRQGLVKKVVEIPPTWQITEQGVAAGTGGAAGRSFGGGGASAQGDSGVGRGRGRGSHQSGPATHRMNDFWTQSVPAYSRGRGRGILSEQAQSFLAAQKAASINTFPAKQNNSRNSMLSGKALEGGSGWSPSPSPYAGQQVTAAIRATGMSPFEGGFKPPPTPADLVQQSREWQHLRDTAGREEPWPPGDAEDKGEPWPQDDAGQVGLVPTSTEADREEPSHPGEAADLDGMIQSDTADNPLYTHLPTKLLAETQENGPSRTEDQKEPANELQSSLFGAMHKTAEVNQPSNEIHPVIKVSPRQDVHESNSLAFSPSLSQGSSFPRPESMPSMCEASPLDANMQDSALPRNSSWEHVYRAQRGDSSADNMSEWSSLEGAQPATGSAQPVVTKSPVSVLMEWAQARQTSVSIDCVDQTGPPHCPQFKMVVTLGERRFPPVFVGNKKEGKREAATAALKTMASEGLIRGGAVNGLNLAGTSEGRTMDGLRASVGMIRGGATGGAAGLSSQPLSQPLSQPDSHTSMEALNSEAFAALNKNPISALMEWAQTRKMSANIEVTGRTGPDHRPKFQMIVTIGGRRFPAVVVTNKKDGRKEAAEVALKTLISEGKYQIQTASTVSPLSSLPPGYEPTYHDRIAALSHQMFNKLLSTVSDSMAGRKVLAAMVMRRNDDDPGQVVSVGTGNRCITGEFMSLEGSTVNDSHAEIITRRGLLRLMYRDLLEHQPGSSESLFTASSSSTRWKLKDGVTFHLYISTAPCGDGALFSPRDGASVQPSDMTGESDSHTPTFSTKVQGLLRTKMEGGEGTIPIEPDFTGQTFDGIMRGERLRTMSCSDKICRWNLLGLQGALLSQFVEPVYLTSLTLGLLYDPGHLSRAVCCRLSHGDWDISQELPPAYRINHPHLGRVTVYEPPRETQKTKEHSINWSLGDERAEMTDGTKGLVIDNRSFPYSTSRVAKAELYRSFRAVCEKYSRSDLLAAETYADAKNMAQHFQTAKRLLFKKFRKSGFSQWVEKPKEETMFSWEGVQLSRGNTARGIG